VEFEIYPIIYLRKISFISKDLINFAYKSAMMTEVLIEHEQHNFHKIK